MTRHTLKIVETSEEPFDCECCGTCYPQGLYIEFNGETVWEKYSDGHYSGHVTENSIVNSILDKWHADMLAIHENTITEKMRLEWDKAYPTSSVAKTREGWLEHQNEYFSFVINGIENIKENCKNLPYDATLQAKMIALWFESETGEVIDIVESRETYNK